MRSYYPELARFEFQHEYYESVQSAFTFQPQWQTQRLLRRFGLLFRSTRDGFTILYQAIKDEFDALVPLRKLPEQFALRFWICTKYPYTGTVSELPLFRPTKQSLYFDNLIDRKDGDTLYLNQAAPAVTAADEKDLVSLAPISWRYSKAATEPVFVRVQNAHGTVVGTEYCRPHEGNVQCLIDLGEIAPGLVSITAGSETTETYYRPESFPDCAPLAAVDLYTGPTVPDTYQFVDSDGVPQPKVFTCRIAKQSSIWRYIIVPRFNTTLQAGQLSIQDADSRYTFGAPTAVQTMSGEAAFAIESQGLIPHQEEPIKGLSLRRNSVDLIPELPNPGPDQIMVGDSGYYSEIHVYV
jgi:hypothetical protein